VNDIDNVIDFFSQARGVIIDVRNNRGGGSAGTDPIIGRFIETAIVTTSAFSKMGSRDPGTILPQGGRQYTGPIAILISGTSFSATEVFADIVRQLDYVTIVGDTTAGGGMSSNGEARHFLPNGGAIRINYEAILRLDGQPIEWNGVPPDIRVVQTKADIENNIDKQLEFAVELLSSN
jgi:carboxyl-terminal processing protease